ncbi:MAG: hypothetical protein FWC27_11870 [Firmicutes bacterium]|nr:hypothetical protein [Bacillota bacterium]
MKYNLSSIARRANALARTMSKSLAWRKAWAEAKIANAESALFVLRMKDRMDAADFTQSRELAAEITRLQASIATAPALRIVEALRVDTLAAYQADKAAKAKAIFHEALRRKDQSVINYILTACGDVVNKVYGEYFGAQQLAA